LRDVTLTGTRAQMRDKLDRISSQGITEIVFQPCGPDPERELERFLEVAR
jgi:5,10-methylenetetrahydromethanopterin reductase